MIRMKQLTAIIGLGFTLVLTGCGQLTGEDSQENRSGHTTPEKESQLNEKEQPKEGQFDSEKEEENQEPSEPNQEEDNQAEQDQGEEQKQTPPAQQNDVVSKPASLQVVVNKQRKLPSTYTPSNLVVPDVPFYFDQFMQKKQLRQEAATALESLFQAAQQEGLNLVAASGYRSYARQKSIYESNVQAYGREEANKFSAQPGHSEHQTGLAMDVTVAELSFKLVQEFGQTPEGNWLANNAYKYGFIIRYPEGKEAITGYSYEPWHLRYVGNEEAKEIHNASQTLEEFYGLMPGEEDPTE